MTERGAGIAQEKEARINGEITAPEVRLVGIESQQLGIMSLARAMAMAEEAEVDLVEIAPTAQPPVCRLMDFGKFKYAESKRRHEAKLKQKQVQVKEVKFRPGTDEGDYQIKLRFRGREMAHQEFGVKLLQRVQADLAELGSVEQFPKLEGRQMIMVIAPRKKN